MPRNPSPILAGLWSLLLAAGCSSSTSPSRGDAPPGGLDPAERPLGTAVIHYGAVDFDDPAQLAGLARGDLLILAAERFWSRNAPTDGVARLKAFNPDLKVLGYMKAKHVRLEWGDPEIAGELREHYPYDLYDATRDFWGRTTTGDTLMDWPNVVVLNILDPACREAMLDIYAGHHRASPNDLDGVFWDFFSPTLWIAPDVRDRVEGEPDLDGDGIGHFEDEDELAAWRSAQESLVRGLRSRLGEDFIQIFNGTRACRDSSFAALGDGMFFEWYPTLVFFGSAPLEQALDPAEPHNMFAVREWPRRRNGGPWLVYSHKTEVEFLDDRREPYRIKYAEFNRVMALLTGGTVVYTRDEQYLASWPEVELDLGLPLGGVSRIDRTVSREFQRGRVSLTFTSGAWPLPFDFEIVQDREVVQALQFPAHVP